MRPRFADPSRTARGDGAVGGARAPTGTLEAGGEPTPRGKAPRAPKARRSASPRSTGHHASAGAGAPAHPPFLFPLEGCLLKTAPLRQGGGGNKTALGGGGEG